MCGQAVLAQLEVHTADVVEVEGAQTLACVSDDGGLGGGAKHLQSLAVVLPEILHVGLQELGAGGLWEGGGS